METPDEHTTRQLQLALERVRTVKKLEWEDSEVTDSSCAITKHFIYVIEKLEHVAGYSVTVNTECYIIENFYITSMKVAKKYCEWHWKKFVEGLLE